jgi:hypothetical protein
MRTVTAAALGLALLAGTMAPAAAADPWDAFWPQPTTVSDKTLPSYSPELTTSADGQRQAVIWTMVQGNDYRAQVATTADGGTTWNTPVDLDTSELIGNASIVGSTDGQRLTAVWNQANPRNLSVRVRQSADGGATWAPAQFISSATNAIPRAAASADGTKVTVVWTEQTMTNTLALVSSWNSTTNTWSGPTIVSPNNDEASYPSITSSADGQVVTVTWLDSTNRLRSATSTNAGASWSSAKGVSTAGLPAYQADLVTSTDGSRIVATWVENDGSDHVAAAYSTDKGATWSTPAALPAWFSNWAPELIATPDAQRLLVSWPATNGQGDTVARTITSKDGGATWTPFVDATPATSSVSEPLIAASSDLARLTMLWHETPAQETTVRAAVSGDSGQTWSSPKIINTSPGYDYPQTRIVAAADGTPTAVWQQDGKAVSRIRTSTATLATIPGAPTGVAATPGDSQAGVTWSAAPDGGSPVTGYTATATPGGASCQAAGLSCTISGLTNGGDYEITVRATNAVGTGPASAPVSVRPTAPLPPPPLQKQTVKKPPAKLKKGKSAKLAKKTSQGAKLKWTTSTKKICVVKKSKVKAKKKGKCKLSANAPATPGFDAFTKRYTIRVK